MAWTTPGTATAGEVLTASFWNTQVRDQFIELASFFSADWTTYSPTYINFTVGTGGTSTGRYLKVGTFVAFWGIGTLGSSGFSVGDVTINLPITASDKGSLSARVEAVDTGVAVYPLAVPVEDASTTGMRVLAQNTTGTYLTGLLLSPTVPFTWGAGDKLRFSGTYEAATP